MEEYHKIPIDKLKGFVSDVFVKLNVTKEDADIIADVLVAADRRGIHSHGVARLRRYVKGIKDGIMIPDAKMEILKETPVSITVDGHGGLGQPVSYRTMEKVIEKALENYIAFGVVRNSNHYGIAGYYAMMALKHDGLIGISITNSAPLVVPTNGRDAIYGTNPIAFAVPCKEEKAFVLDMATSTVPRGKLEVYNRHGKPIPEVWATDETGKPTTDPSVVLKNLLERRGGGLLPLGGAEEETGGHKGYGLGVIVDIFSGVLSNGAFGLDVYGKKGEPPNVCHFFGAMRVDAFTDVSIFKENMDKYMRMLKNSNKAEGKERIYVAGEKEWEQEERFSQEVEIYYKVVEDMREIGSEVGVTPPF